MKLGTSLWIPTQASSERVGGSEGLVGDRERIRVSLDTTRTRCLWVNISHRAAAIMSGS